MKIFTAYDKDDHESGEDPESDGEKSQKLEQNIPLISPLQIT